MCFLPVSGDDVILLEFRVGFDGFGDAVLLRRGGRGRYIVGVLTKRTDWGYWRRCRGCFQRFVQLTC